MLRIYIIGIKTTDNVKNYALLARSSRDGKLVYDTAIVEEKHLINKMLKGEFKVRNATIVDGRIKGTTGDLSRFENGVNSPYVILSILKDDTGDTLGYKVSDCSGRVSKLPLKVILEQCETIKKRGGIPFQNGMYVDGDTAKPYIKAYPNGEYQCEQIAKKVRNESAKPAEIDAPSNKKNLSRLEEMFSKKQIEELRAAKNDGVNIKIIGNNKLSPEQMRIIRNTKKKGLPAELFADPDYSLMAMKFIAVQMEFRKPFKVLLNPKYNLRQMGELLLGMEYGLDVNKYSNPKYSADEMSSIRETLYDKQWNTSVVTGTLFE